MELYYTKSSPYANCVRMVITEMGIETQVNMIESHPFKNEAAFLQATPLGKVPCLVDGAESIVDSEVICDYLDANFTGGTLFNPIYADWRLKSLYSICSGLMDSLVARRIEITRSKDGTQSIFWLDRHTEAIIRSLAYIENRQSLFPEDFSILQINLMSCLAYLDFRHQDISWRERFPQLANFECEFKTRPCVLLNQLSDE